MARRPFPKYLSIESNSSVLEYESVLRHWVLRIMVGLGAHRRFLGSNGFADEEIARLIGYEDEDFQDEKGNFDRKSALAALRAMLMEMDAENERPQVEGVVAENARRLGDLLGLTEVEREILEFTVLPHGVSLLGSATEYLGEITHSQVATVLKGVLNRSLAKVTCALADGGALNSCGLVVANYGFSATLQVRLTLLSDGFSDRMTAPVSNVLDLVQDTISPAPTADLSKSHYGHIKPGVDFILGYLRRAVAETRHGVNILLYGTPGTGKTQLASLIAQQLGHPLYEIAIGVSDDAHGSDGRVAAARLRAFKAAQKLFREQQVLLMFDEAEDVFNDGASFFGRKSTAQLRKAWMNEMLEENSVPTLWSSNSAACLDPAFVRRFDIVVECPVSPGSQRAELAQSLAGERLTQATRTRLAAHADLAPAVLQRAIRVVESAGEEFAPEAFSSMVETLVNGALKAQGHSGLNKGSGSDLPPWYNAGLINADCDMTQLASGLAESKSGRICLYGPPGTGKSAYGRWLAEQLGKPLLAKRASDIISCYLGETEQNLARLFEQAEADLAVLLLDEVDSFLQRREGAQRSWEVTQVNEMLTQMEAFGGVFVASTNLMHSLDEAALRRFDIAVQFDYLKPSQAAELFQDLCEDLRLESGLSRDVAALSRLAVLTPGDFAQAAR